MKDYDKIIVGKNQIDLNKSMHVALANVRIHEEDIESSYRNSPNTGRKRLTKLVGLLRDVANYRDENNKAVDLLLFPEASLPHSWESMIITWARKHNIGVICGFEHRIYDNYAYNEMMAALPYVKDDKVTICVPIKRIKHWYSPQEEFDLEQNHLKIPNQRSDNLQLIVWRGASISIYNCFELTDIRFRSILIGKVDLLIALEFNRDVNYFANIVESASRDIHCYVAQVNDSKFGDTRIVSPSKTEKMNPLRIKGGDNSTFLTVHLDFRKLRDHQRVKYGIQKDSEDFKPTPPQLNIEDVLERISLGKTIKKQYRSI